MADHYTYRIMWSPEDGEHVAVCVEFPSLSWLASTPDKALAGIRRLVASVLEDMRATGEKAAGAAWGPHLQWGSSWCE